MNERDGCDRRESKQRRPLPPEGPQCAQERHESDRKVGRPALETPRFSNAEARSHEQGEVEPRDVHEEALGDVLVFAEVSASHAASLEGVSEGPLEQFSAQAH